MNALDAWQAVFVLAILPGFGRGHNKSHVLILIEIENAVDNLPCPPLTHIRENRKLHHNRINSPCAELTTDKISGKSVAPADKFFVR